MPFVQPTTVPMSFTGGLQSKNDALQVQPPNVLEAQNIMFNKIGQFNKRPGYNILNNTVLNGGIITSAFAIDNFNSELNLFDNQNIYTFISSASEWSNRGTAISLIQTNNQIVRSSAAQQLNPDVCSLNGITAYVWEDSRGGVRLSILDQATDSFVVSDAQVNGVGTRPKVIANAGLIYIFYTDALNNLFYRTLNPANPNVVSPQVSCLADGGGDGSPAFVFDICTFSNRIYVAYSSTNGTNNFVKMLYIDSANVVHGPAIARTFAANAPVGCIACTSDSNNFVWVAWGITASSVGPTVEIANFTGGLSLTVNYTLDAGLISTIGIIESVQMGSIQAVYEFVGATPNNQRVRSKIAAPSGVTLVVGDQRGVGLASKPFKFGANSFVHLCTQSPEQNTYFMSLLTNIPFTVVGKVAYQVGGGFRTNNTLSSVVTLSPGVFLWANLIKGRFISEDNTNFSFLGVNSTQIDFTNSNKFNSITFSNNLLFVGGILQSYDGIYAAEQNFHLFPEGSTAVPQGGGGSLSAGQYQYQIVYAWTDKFGQIQYSTPSPTITITTIVNDSVLLTIPTLRLTAKTGVVIKIYRTLANNTIFQEVTSELAPTLNNPSVDSITFLDTAADTQIAANQTIYTTGGVLPNSAPPSCSMISLFSDRVMLSGLEDPNLIWFSKNRVNSTNFNTIPVEFSADLTIAVSQVGGPITALGLMDQNLIIFKRSAIFILSGDGPNDEGGGNNFADPQIITQNVGCVNPNSIVLTGQGLMFQTPDKGIWMLERSLGPPVYVGAGVDDQAKQFSISSATLDQNSNSVIFTTFQGPALVYDYLIGQWSTWTNHQSVDGISFNGTFTFVKSNGQVYQQNPNIFYDGILDGYQVPYFMEFTTPWISYASVLGYQSIFKVFILGQYRSPHNLNVSVGYNFDPNFTKAGVINTSQTAGSNTWGSDGYWGTSTPWGSVWMPYIFQINMPIQKCTSFRLKFADSQVGPYNEGFTANSLLFELGVLGGGVRIPVTNKVGAQ